MEEKELRKKVIEECIEAAKNAEPMFFICAKGKNYYSQEDVNHIQEDACYETRAVIIGVLEKLWYQYDKNIK